ncbi:hypothetical protein A2973_04680 [Candidatus Gottesmanbacteria bacterium RIFCSPLOWO2_01_FULL_49_10]|uniref:Uncharacterized protein n=1 Tax=Candidatus Gottesmanbacteria bacterium RIFCSPLOWO2_01_FULL_49_10 TaxID=1798396 RepID=A0A1F6AZR4_9BACT|nr:MAG: hypothetical protein A2973_04680 [Candidatus Gottesmanbacteria bacterium RIFCSPLOWO2_01_FULL_49_10]
MKNQKTVLKPFCSFCFKSFSLSFDIVFSHEKQTGKDTILFVLSGLLFRRRRHPHRIYVFAVAC